jgi:hypothetical protein
MRTEFFGPTGRQHSLPPANRDDPAVRTEFWHPTGWADDAGGPRAHGRVARRADAGIGIRGRVYSPRLRRPIACRTSSASCADPVRVGPVGWFFALVDWRISRREFGHGDLFLTREEAERALAEVLRDEPDLEPFLSVEAVPLPQTSPN